MVAQLILCAFAVILLALLGSWRDAGFTRIPDWKTFLPFLPLLIVPLLILGSSGIYMTDPVQIGLAFIFTLAIGFSEEIVFRGIVLRLFLPNGVMRAAIIASFVFGLIHLGNLFAGQPVGLTIVQVFFAALGGFGLAAPYIRTNAIWPLVIIHMLVDFMQKLAKGFGHSGVEYSSVEMAIYLLGAIVIAVYGYWLLRKEPGRLKQGEKPGRAPSILPGN